MSGEGGANSNSAAGGGGGGGGAAGQSSAALSDVMGLLRRRDDAPSDAGQGNSRMICRRCGRRGHVARNCMFADKCAICGRVGHFAKDCKGFLKAAKAIEGKQFAQQQAAMRSAEDARMMEELLNRNPHPSAPGASSEAARGGDARPTDFLTDASAGRDGARGAPGKRQPQPVAARVRVVKPRTQTMPLQPKQPSVWQSRPAAAAGNDAGGGAVEQPAAGAGQRPAEKEEEDEDEANKGGPQLGGLLAAYGSDTDEEQEEQPALEQRGEKDGQRAALPSAADLLDDGPASAANPSGGSFLQRQLSGGQTGFDHQESQRREALRERLAKEHRVLEVRRTGGSVLGEEITVRCTSAAARFLLRHLSAIQRGTGAAVTAEKGGEDGFRISRKPPVGPEAVRRAAAILSGGVGAYVDILCDKSAGADAESLSRAVDGVVFSMK